MANRILVIPLDQSRGADAASSFGLTTPEADDRRTIFEVAKHCIISNPGIIKNFPGMIGSLNISDTDLLWALALGLDRIVGMGDKELSKRILYDELPAERREELDRVMKEHGTPLLATTEDVQDVWKAWEKEETL